MSTENSWVYDTSADGIRAAGANRTAGYSFVPTVDIVVSAIRIKGTANYITKAYIWNASTKENIVSVDMNLVKGEWTIQQINPVTLFAGTTYIIAQNIYSAYGYYGAVSPAMTISDKLSAVRDLRIDALNTIPNSQTGWYIAIGFVIGVSESYCLSGNCEYTIEVGSVAQSQISWLESTTEKTSVLVSRSVDNGANWTTLTNGGELVPEGEYSGQIIKIRIELSTTDSSETPTISNMQIVASNQDDKKSIILEMEPLERFESAAGDMTVSYDGEGTLEGQGGAVEAFTVSFTPTELISKPDQNDQEHIEMAVSVLSNLMQIYYADSVANEHIELSATVTGTLTHINNI